MALMTCSECSGNVSDKANLCPHCGGTVKIISNMTKKGTELINYLNGDIQIGDYVQMGNYYDKPIQWRCVDIDENGPLMLADKILAIKAFDARGTHKHMDGTTQADTGRERTINGSNIWETSNLRAWLNSTAIGGKVVRPDGCPPATTEEYNGFTTEKGFMADGNFTAGERSFIKSVIQKSLIDPVDVPKLKVSGTVAHIYSPSISAVVQNYDAAYYQNVTDKMFLLDVRQLNKVYQNLGASYYIGQPTNEAVENAKYKISGLSTAENWYYWLRSPDVRGFIYSVRCVHLDGSVDSSNAYYSSLGVRPAFYINIKSGTFKAGIGTEVNPFKVEKENKEFMKEFKVKQDKKTETISSTNASNLNQPINIFNENYTPAKNQKQPVPNFVYPKGKPEILSETWIATRVEKQQTRQRGKDIYQSGGVLELYETGNLGFKGVVRGSDKPYYNLSFRFTNEGNICDMDCSCPAKDKYKKACKHLVAAFYKLQNS